MSRVNKILERLNESSKKIKLPRSGEAYKTISDNIQKYKMDLVPTNVNSIKKDMKEIYEGPEYKMIFDLKDYTLEIMKK